MNDKEEFKPSGGFPPLTICKKYEKTKKLRGFSSIKSAVSIKDIIEKKKEKKDFI